MEWRNARKFFYWRLRRRLGEERAIKLVTEADRCVCIIIMNDE